MKYLLELCSYRMTRDTGFAPNPFGEYCTLATCMVKLRASKNIKSGSWIVGIGGSETPVKDKLIYAMKVTEIISIENYWNDHKFASKKPNHSSSHPEDWVGDNIYYKKQGKWIQFKSFHSNPDGTQNEAKTKHDTEKGKNILISNYFYYFGENALEIPSQFDLIKQKTFRIKCNYPKSLVQDFIKWLEEKDPDMYGKPSMLPNRKIFASTGDFTSCDCKYRK